MISILLKIITCQFIFLLIYELLLKRETFFQWNRIYLISTSIFAVSVPFLKINWVEKQLPQRVSNTINEIVLYASKSNDLHYVYTINSAKSFELPWETILILGSFLFLIIFLRKFYQLNSLKIKSQKIIHPTFIEYKVPNSDVAFSFINSIFIGDKVNQLSYESIINHEIVHLNQKHSYDLIFFELLKIVFWFNPFIYLYQRYTSEIHEYIADQATKKNQSHYENLLNEVFSIENFKFTNQFFNQSLIKKRIVMLNKKSKKSNMLKYLLIIPVLITTILISTSSTAYSQENGALSEAALKEKIYREIKKNCEEINNFKLFINEAMVVFSESSSTETPLTIEEFYKANAYLRLLMEKAPTAIIDQNQVQIEFIETLKKSISYSQYLENFKNNKDKEVRIPKSSVTFKLPEVFINRDEAIPFLEIEQAPLFEDCENNTTKDCFMNEIQNHVKMNFNYPLEAMENNIEGKVYCSFIINETGEIVIVDLRGPDSILEKSVYDLMMELPKLKPAMHKGNPTKMSFSIPISFKLE